jgi:MoxR-like ATPase
MESPETVGILTEILRQAGYLADRGLATAMFVAMSLNRPLLLEGEVGVGKTEIAKVMASVFGRKLIRLQCYEGIDTNQALYEWDYARQMLHIRALSEHQAADAEAAVRAGDQAVLLIDEIDRADDEFEAFLLEVLSDFQISIPEIGTIKAERPPLVVLTSNRTRELHDALKRRCLYHWIDYPTAEREVEIVLIREPGISAMLAGKVVSAVQRLRELDLAKPPGVAETIDWARTLDFLGETDLKSPLVSEIPDPGSAPFIGLLVNFADELRAAGLAVGSGDVLVYCSAAGSLDPADLVDLYWAGRTTLVNRRDDIAKYDEVFRRFFLEAIGPEEDVLALMLRASAQAQGALAIPSTEPGQDEQEDDATLGWMASDVDALKHKSFAACTPDELAALRRIMARIRLTPPRRRTRRSAASRTGSRPDPRRTIRESMRMHGEPRKTCWR